MKNKIIKILLSTMIVSLSVPFIHVYGKENSINAGIIKELNEWVEDSIEVANEKSYRKVYTTANVNIRESPNIDAKILDIIDFNKKIKIFDINDKWAIVEVKNSNLDYAYINKNYIAENQCAYIDYTIPKNEGFKSFMPYTAITDMDSLQYNMQQNYAYTGEFGIRQVNGRFCVAIGTAFETTIGTYFDLILENNTKIPCIVSDIKADKDTLLNNITTANNGCVSEFVVDLDSLNLESKRTGDVSSCKDKWNSPVKIMRIYVKNIFD